MALKPIPKAIGIALVVGLVGFGLTKALPTLHTPAPQTQGDRTFDVGTTDLLHKPAPADEADNASQVREQAARISQAERQASANASTDAGPTVQREPTVSNGGRGLDALMKAGSK